MATSPRSILSWLRRCRRDELPVERTLTAIRSVHGLVPLGGRVGGTDGATPPTTPQSAAFSLFSTSQDATCAADVERDEPIEAVRWELLLASVRLPSSGGLRELEHALETLSKLTLSTQAQHSTVDTDRLRQAYFAARREFFTVRIELLRTARNVQHPNAQAAREIVNELLTEGLGDALVDEMLGRQFYQAPSFRRVGKDERKALVAWEVQFLQEEALLRELLLLTLEFSEVHATLERAVAIAKTVHVWDVQVLDELIMNSTLELPGAQQAVETLTQVGVLVALRMLHTTVAGLEHEALLNASKTFFLTNLCGLSGVELRPSPVPGVLLLAWATLLGRQYHVKVGLDGDSAEVKELRDALQQTLASAERLRSFHYLNSLMRSLVFGIDSANAGLARLKPLLQPLSPYAKALWILPTDAVSAGPNGVNATHSDVLVNCDSAPVYQYVVAVFLNEMLSSLGYIKNLDDAQQLHAMVKFVLPALSNTRVSQQIFDIELEDSCMVDNVAPGAIATLRELLTKTRACLPCTVVPCIQLFTALCCNYQGASSPTVLRQVLRYFSMPHAGKDETVAAGDGWHPLPPREYYTEIGDGQDTLLCTRSFAYGGANEPSVVPAQTVGTILRYGDVVKVTWQFSDGDGDTYAPTMWDLLFQSADRLMTGHESRSFADLYHTNVEDVHILTSFFGFIVQLGNQEDNGEVVVEEMERCWGEARLRHWWISHKLPSPQVYVSQLLAHKIALSTLLSASRENLVSWGIRERYIQDQIMVRLGDVGGLGSGSTSMGLADRSAVRSMASYSVEGGTHLLRVVLRVLCRFLHTASHDDNSMEDDSPCFVAHMHLVAASFVALRTIIATASGVELFMSSSLGGGQEGCLATIVESAKKFFELQERSAGEYSVVLATQDIFMRVVRWFLLKEAQSLADFATRAKVSPIRLRKFIDSERLWFASAVEFVNGILSTYESWKFVATNERCEVAERCLRLLYVLVLPRKCVNEHNDMLPAFEAALRGKLSVDTTFVMKLLRSSCAVLSAMDGKSGCWNNLSSTGVHEHRSMLSSGTERGDSHVLLRHIGEFGSDVINMVQLESLVTTCLRFVTLLISNRRNVVDLEAARKILLIPIAYGGMKERKELTVVTLCGEYLGYPLELAPGIAHWSLRILQHAAVAVDFRQERESRNPSVMQSLVSLFHGCEDLDIVRGAFAQLLSVSPTQRFALQKEVIHMLALCLKHQPGFLALLLFGVSSTNDPKSDKMKNEKAKGDDVSCMLLLERLFEDPVRLLEQASDLFCTLLAFVVQVWKGAVHNRFGIHMRIMTTLRANPSFWLNVTQAIKIHMPSDTEEGRGLLDMELAAATSLGGGDTHSLSSSSEVYIGRSSAFGYMARGLILQLVSYEWHNEASELKDHPLVDVLESFREEGLYSHWLRTFTRLDYSPVQLKLYAPSIQRACNPRAPITSMHGMIPVDGVFMYLEGLICNNRQLEWQFGHGACAKQEASSADIRMLKLLRWSNLQAAYLHAQLFSLSKWKVFMELCCFQVDEETRGVSGLELTSRTTEPRCRKRKESMISSPSRNSGSRRMQSAGATSTAFLTPSSSEHSLSSSRFSGDRTSFEMIRVLADVIEASVDQHGNQGEVLDYFVLLHLHGLVQLLVSMLHHQLCLVVRKTYDPKLSQTRQRFEGSEPHFGLKLDARATLQLLSLVDKTVSAVHDSVKRVAREADIVGHDANNQSMSTSVELATSVPLISRLVTDFEQSLKSVTDGLLTLLVTAALLLVRHLNKISGHLSHSAKRETEAKGVLTTKALVPMKWIAHCVNVFTLCNDREEQTRSSQALFQLSWCLWQEVVDNYGNSNAPLVGVSEPRMMNVMQLNPFVMDMEYEQQGIRAVLHLLVQRFRPLSPSKQVSASQEDACQVLRGLAAVVWNPANSARPSFCLRLISLLTAQLLPLLRSRMEREEATSKLRGYILQKSDDVMTGQLEDNIHLQRSVAHEMWCLVLDIVSGLLHLHAEYTVVGSDKLDVWEFMSSAESLLLAAVEPSTCPRLTRATIAEHQSLLQLLSGLSRSASTRKCWRQAFPTSAVVLMEQSRQLLRHACVLLGSSSTKDNRYYSEKVEWQNGSRSANNAIVSYGKNRSSKSPRSPRSPSAFPYACETLLHEQLHAVRDVEKREVRAFHREMETELVKVVRFASLLLSKWTASPTDRGAVLVVGGVRCVDEEQLVPLLAFAPPSEARSRNGSPSLGHLSLAMDFILDRLLAKEDPQLGLQTVEMRMGLANAMNACALLFLKTCCLYAEQYELVKRDRDEFSSFFRRFHARIHEDETGATSAVDMQLLQHIDLVIAGQ